MWGKTTSKKKEKPNQKKDILFVLLTCRVRSKTVRDFIQIAKFAKVHKICFFVSLFFLYYFYAFILLKFSARFYKAILISLILPYTTIIMYHTFHIQYSLFFHIFWSIISNIAKLQKETKSENQKQKEEICLNQTLVL